MLVRVLIFGPLRAEIGADAITLELPPTATIAAVNAALAARFPGRAAFFQSARLALNNTFARPDQPVNESDEIALIELVSGG